MTVSFIFLTKEIITDIRCQFLLMCDKIHYPPKLKHIRHFYLRGRTSHSQHITEVNATSSTAEVTEYKEFIKQLPLTTF